MVTVKEKYKIPEHTYIALKAYVQEGHPTGDFLFSVLTNNLFGALGYADDENFTSLQEICKYIYNDVPKMCWGTPETVQAWIDHRGLKGLK